MFYSYSGDLSPTLSIILGLCCCVILIPLFAFWVMMLIDAIKRVYPQDKESERTLWIIVVLIGGWIGAAVYYFMVKKKYPTVTNQTTLYTESPQEVQVEKVSETTTTENTEE